MRTLRFVLLPLLLAAAVSAAPGSAASAGDDTAAGESPARAKLRAEIARIYDYHPADVDKATRERKSADMDGFWNLVKSDEAAYLPVLREALRDPQANSFFCFDGAALLFDRSKDRDDLALTVASMVRCGLGDLSHGGYFQLAHRVCREDVDAWPAIAVMLDEPKFGFYLTQHAMRIAQRDCVLLCALEQGEDRWVPHFAERLPRERDETAARTLLHCLTVAATPAADAALLAYAADEQAPAALRRLAVVPRVADRTGAATTTTREQFDEFLASLESEGRLPYKPAAILVDAFVHVRKADAPTLRAGRRKVARRVSDESLGELPYIARLIRAADAAN